VEILTRRIACADRRHVLAQQCLITAAEGPADLEVAAGVDIVVWSLNGDHFRSFEVEDLGDVIVASGTSVDRGVRLAVATRIDITGLPGVGNTDDGERVMRRTAGPLETGAVVTVETAAAVFSSNDVDDPAAAAVAEVRSAPGYHELLERHTTWWRRFWERTDVAVDGPAADRVAIRFAAYHNRISTPAHTDHLPIGARGLSCQAYQGAAFWDQEIFNLPVFLFTEPEIARNILVYRHRTLDGARRKAARLGYAGAFYAWISGDTGDELCPDVFFTDVLTGRPIRTHFNDWQIHVAPDIVTTIDRYVEVTGDQGFLVEHGAEIAFEVARFLHSFVRLDPRWGTYHCIRLLGPDEWHENVDDNAFTNYQVVAALRAAVRIHRWMAAEHPQALAALAGQIGLEESEVAAWAHIAEWLFLPPPNPETGIVEQFAGFGDLEDITPAELRERLLHPSEYWGGPAGIAVPTKVAKQADVVMLMWLHEAVFSPEIRAANLDYYEPFCAHGSSLSASAHAMVNCRLGRPDEALSWFRDTAMADLGNTQEAIVGGTFIGGIHLAACAGTYQVATQGFGGLGYAEGRLRVEPALPEAWRSISYPVAWRGSRLRVTAGGGVVEVSSAPDSKGPVPLRIAGTGLVLEPGATATVGG
jgi:kojibiose phosphorylase